jgi:hypothetical protein
MALSLTPAEKQRRYRDRLKAATQMSPDVVEGALVQEADRCEELSSEQRAALADKLGAIAKRHLWRAHELAELARKVSPPGSRPPGAPK